MLRVITTMTGLPGAPYYSTQYFDSSIPGTQGEADIAAEAVFNFWTDLAGYITAGLTIDVGDEVDVLDAPTGLVQDTFVSPSVPIVSGGNAPLPKATQGLVRLRTNTFIAGRRLQGRIFIPALANDAQLGGVPSSGFLTAMGTVGANLISDSAGAPVGIWHRPTGGPGSSDGDFAPAVSASGWNQFAVLRSRRD